MNHRVRIGVVDVVDDDGVVGGLGRNALIVDDLDRRAGILDELAERVGLGAGEFVGRVEDGDLLDAEARPIMRDEVGDRLRPDGRDRIGHQRDVGIVLGEEAGAGAGLVEQEHLVVARDRDRRRRQHRAGIGDQEVDLVLRDELVVERGGGRGVALVVIGDELDREFSCRTPSRRRRPRHSSGRPRVSARCEPASKSRRSVRTTRRACRS